MYVACSRPRMLEKLWLLRPLEKQHFQYGMKVYTKIAEEYERLKKIHGSQM